MRRITLEKVERGQNYIHKKNGRMYYVFCTNARMEKDGRQGEPYVIHCSHGDPRWTWVTPLSEFLNQFREITSADYACRRRTRIAGPG